MTAHSKALSVGKKADTPELFEVQLNPEGKMRDIGGAGSDLWNSHFLGQLVAAFPNALGAQRSEVIQAIAVAQSSIGPKDPIEAMLAGQMLAANETALDLYRRAWVPEQSFEVRTKFLALADKAARTVAVLTEALDRHRGKGQQHITVRHVTVNADQAVVTDQFVAGAQSQTRGRG